MWTGTKRLRQLVHALIFLVLLVPERVTAQDKPKIEIVPFSSHSAPITAVAYSHDGTRLLSSSEDATLKLWEAATGRPFRTFEGHTGPVSSVAFSPDGTRLLSGSEAWALIAKDGQKQGGLQTRCVDCSSAH